MSRVWLRIPQKICMLPVRFPGKGIQEQLATCSQLSGEVWFEVEIWVSSAQRSCPTLWARMPKSGAVWSRRECCLVDTPISPGPGHWSNRQQLSVQKWEFMSSDLVKRKNAMLNIRRSGQESHGLTSSTVALEDLHRLLHLMILTCKWWKIISSTFSESRRVAWESFSPYPLHLPSSSSPSLTDTCPNGNRLLQKASFLIGWPKWRVRTCPSLRYWWWWSTWQQNATYKPLTPMGDCVCASEPIQSIEARWGSLGGQEDRKWCLQFCYTASDDPEDIAGGEAQEPFAHRGPKLPVGLGEREILWSPAYRYNWKLTAEPF